ncbi:MAG: hypothetical protein ACJAYN_000797 [Bermanella sp.]|jgi:hypothetical protein
MKKYSKERSQISLKAQSELTHISIFDSKLRRIDSGLGALNRKLEKGIYKIRWSTNGEYQDQIMEVDGSIDLTEIEGPNLQTNSSAPFVNSKHGQIDVRKVQSQRESKEGFAQVLVIIRDVQNAYASWIDSVSLSSIEGDLIESPSVVEDDSELVANIDSSLPPGVYRLKVDTASLGSYEIFVSLVEGWQTQVFLLCEDFYMRGEPVRRPALRTASILMCRAGEKFGEDNKDAMFADYALKALIGNYKILDSRMMRELLRGKFDDPILGIYAAHLLLRDRKKFRTLIFNEICQNLLSLVGPTPDVQALITKSDLKNIKLSEVPECYRSMPPMLIYSWDLLVKRSHRKFSIIEQGSVSDIVSDSIVASEPWMLVRNARLDNGFRKGISVARGKRELEDLFSNMKNSKPGVGQAFKVLKENKELEPLESAILKMAVKYGQLDSTSSSYEKMFDKNMSNLTNLNALPEVADWISAVSKINAPSYSIARSVASLLDKLDVEES